MRDYRAFADLSAAPGGSGGAGVDAESPVHDYLAAAGVSPDHAPPEAPPLPPTELMIDPAQGAHGPDHPLQTDDAAVDHIPVDLPEAPLHEDPQQYHGM